MAQAAQQPVVQQQTGGAQAAPQPASSSDQSNLPQVPQPKLTEPLYLRDTGIDYTHAHGWIPNPLKMYAPTSVPAARLGNTPAAGTNCCAMGRFI